MNSLKLHAVVEHWPLLVPFRITGHVWRTLDVLFVSVEKDGAVGSGEAAGVYYKRDTPDTMLRQVEAVRGEIEAGMTRARLRQIMPPGGARNALDCAFWALESKVADRPVWQLAGLQPPKPILTTFTCGAADPAQMATVARSYEQARAIKLKLTGEGVDDARVRAVREARPDVWLGVDANQGFTPSYLKELLPTLVAARVSLIEQPFPVGQESLLDGVESPIPIAADETVQSLADLPAAAERFDAVNLKLDKCGGLTEAIEMARAAHALGLETMVGNMIGTSLAMAPAWLVGQFCQVVDLDGPIFLESDRSPTVQYIDGCITCPVPPWG